MHTITINWIIDILNSNPHIIPLAVCQRAKFEGWLKFELARKAILNGATEMQVEYAVNHNQGRVHIDLKFCYGGNDYLIELKTANTSYSIPRFC